MHAENTAADIGRELGCSADLVKKRRHQLELPHRGRGLVTGAMRPGPAPGTWNRQSTDPTRFPEVDRSSRCHIRVAEDGQCRFPEADDGMICGLPVEYNSPRRPPYCERHRKFMIDGVL